jgi:glycosyltransferase involved in cell wall biosynthesis
MKILMVLLQKFPPDIRVEKEARTLTDAGHEVTVIAAGENGEAGDCVLNGIRLVRIPKPPGWRGRYGEIKDALIHRDRFWIEPILRVGRDTGAEVIHGHDLWVLGNCLSAAKRLGIPVIADLHENWPATMSLFHPRETWLDHVTHPILFGYRRWLGFERSVLRKVDRVITVVPEAAARLVAMHSLPREKIAVVSNTEDIDFASNMPIDNDLTRGFRDNFTLIYVGGFNSHRGLDLVIKAMPTIASRLPHVKLILVGSGNERHLEAVIRKANAEPFVDMLGWQPFEKVYSYIMNSDVCLVPHIRHEHTDNTVPHKLFQYMYMRKPVIVSDCPPLKRIVEESHAGLVFRTTEPQSFCEAVYRLAADQDLRRGMGEAGHSAVKRKYNWQEDARVLLQCYAQLKTGVSS